MLSAEQYLIPKSLLINKVDTNRNRRIISVTKRLFVHLFPLIPQKQVLASQPQYPKPHVFGEASPDPLPSSAFKVLV